LCSSVIQIEENKQKKSNIKRKVCLELLKKEQKIFVLYLSRNQHLKNKMNRKFLEEWRNSLRPKKKLLKQGIVSHDFSSLAKLRPASQRVLETF